MKVVKAITELRFSGTLKLLKPFEELYVAITGEEPKDKLQPTPALGLQVKEKRLRIGVEAKRCWVDLEEIPNPGYCVQIITSIFKKIDDLIGIPLLARVGVRSMRIEPSEEEFRELVARYKRIMLGTSELFERAVDLGVVLNLTDDDRKVTLITGPMELTQLKRDFLLFEPVGLPNTFIFADMDYATTSETKYSPKFLSDFITRGLSYAEEQSEKVLSTLRS